MNTEQQLIRACIDDPMDNTLHLAYADYLDETYPHECPQRARSEWIRLTCSHNGGMTDTKNRQHGEPAWIRCNLHRLWPNVYSHLWMNRRVPRGVRLLSGKIVFSIPIIDPNRALSYVTNPNDPRYSNRNPTDHSVVALYVKRGITSMCHVTFLRAAIVAPLIARDEPYVRFGMNCPQIVFRSTSRWISVAAEPFRKRGLVDVFRKIPVGADYGAVDVEHKIYKIEEMRFYRSARERAERDINTALTEWAHERAQTYQPEREMDVTHADG